MITRVLLFIIFSFLYAIYKYYVFVAKFPKGPRPLPFIGNLAQYDFHAQNVSLHRIGRRQSSVYTLFTPLPVVHITKFALLKEAFIENGGSFVDRLENSTIQETYSFTPNGGVILANGDSWRDNRRAALHILRDSGMGKQGMAELVRESVADYIAHLDHLADSKIVSFRWPIQIMVANIINEVLFGFRYKFDECEPLMKYVNGFTKAMEDTVKSKSLLLCIVFPSLRNLPLIGTTKIRKQFAQINEYIVTNATRALKNYDKEDEPTCFVQAYSQKMGVTPHLNEPNLMSTCSDFFLAGQETTTTTMRWGIMMLAANKRVQDKLREEIHRVIGKERIPSMADQQKLPYSRACVLEIQRKANILATNLIRVSNKDVTLGGHFIPRGTHINGDIHFMLNNDPLFVHPEQFNPDRYLNDDGITLKQELVDHTLPFSIGKRACAGEGLARVELFVGITATVQRFRVSPLDGERVNMQQAKFQASSFTGSLSYATTCVH